MIKYEAIKCTTLNEIDDIISFFESVFIENHDIKDIKKTSANKKEEMLEYLNDKDYYLYYIKNNEKIIAAIYANYICERLYLSVIAVDKNYRLQGISKYLINNVVDLCGGKVKEIHVWPNKLDKDKSYSYYLHNGFKPILYISNYEGVDLNDYNKYGFEIYESKIENYHSEGVEYSFCNYKYYVDSPKEEYISYYEKTIPNILAWYIFIKKIQDN